MMATHQPQYKGVQQFDSGAAMVNVIVRLSGLFIWMYPSNNILAERIKDVEVCCWQE